MRRILCTAVLIAVALAGCGGGSDDDAPSGVLSAEDVPGVVETYPQTTRVTVDSVAVCPAISNAEFSLPVGNVPSAVGVAYRLEGEDSSGDYVSSLALGLASQFGSPQQALTTIEEAIEDCSANSSGETVTAMTDLPDGAIGYRAVLDSSDAPRIGERVFAAQGDRIVAVGVQHDGPGEPAVDVAELLPVALERAEDAPSE